MPAVELSWPEATREDLPRVCVICGDAAAGFEYLNTLVSRKPGRVRTPFCTWHLIQRRQRNRLGLILIVSSVLASAVGLIGFPLMAWEASELRIGPGSYMWRSFVLCWPAMALVLLWLRFVGIRVKNPTKTGLIIAGSAPEFAEAVRVYRQDKASALSRYCVSRDTVEPEGSKLELGETAAQALQSAEATARQLQHDHVGTGHLLAALARDCSHTAGFVLQNLSIIGSAIEAELARTNPARQVLPTDARLPRTPALRKVITRAVENLRRQKRQEMSDEDLLLGLFEVGEGGALDALANLGLEVLTAHAKVVHLLESRNRRDAIEQRKIDYPGPPT
jgi:ATP-dependent Clp protease ATP-binding subunit ClpC